MPEPFQSVEDLGKLVKKKYPGPYDSLSDVELGRKVRAKYPQYSKFHDMPDAYFQLGETLKRDKEQLKKMQPGETGFFTGLGTTLAKDITSIPGALWQAGQHPIDTGKAMWEQQVAQYQKSKEAFQQAAELQKQGRDEESKRYLTEALGYGAAAFLPVIGPAAAQAGEEFGGKQYGAGTAHALELLGPEAAKAVVSPVTSAVKGALRSRVTPTEAAHLAEFETRGGQLTRGQKLGIPALEKGERAMRNIPGSEPVAEKFYKTQGAELERQARESVAKVSPVKLENYESGRTMRDRFEAYVNQQKTSADELYNRIRQTSAKAKVRLQTGTRQVPGTKATLTPGGMPSTVPVFEEFEAPVDIQAMRTQLGDLYNDLASRMPETQQQANPGFKALQHLMTSEDRYVNAVDLDRDLGAIKQLVRQGQQSRLLTTRAQAVGQRVIDAGEQQITQALERAQPGLSKALTRARDYVKEYHRADEMLQKLLPANEPVQVFTTMTKQGDQVYDLLSRIQKIAPDESRTLARTYLEGLLEKGYGRTGRLERSEGMLKGWNDLGPKTKQLWFGPQLTKELDSLFRNMRTLAPAEGSQTAWRLPAIKTVLGAGSALGALATGHPLVAAGTAGTLTGTAIGMNVLARILFRQGGPTLVGKALSSPVATGAFREAVRGLNARAAVAQREELQDRSGKGTGKATPSPAGRVGLERDITQAAERHQVPPGLLRVMAQMESGGRADAVSPKGAQGLMQLMPATARQYGVSDPFDPRQSVEGSARFVRHLMEKYSGNVRLVLAAYNAGEDRVDQAGGRVPDIQETRNYVAKGMRLLSGETQ